MITKSDFLLFLDAPRHLWAKKNKKIETKASDFEQLKGLQGYEVEELAIRFLEDIIQSEPDFTLDKQVTLTDGEFEARVDALVYRSHERLYDLFEIKSSTNLEKNTISDVAFQTRILSECIPLNNIYVVYLNKDFVLEDSSDLTGLFKVTDCSTLVDEILPAIDILRQQALEVLTTKNPKTLEPCDKPKECPCLSICHPGLPEFSIYDVPRLTRDKRRLLREEGILAAKDIPGTFELSKKQSLIVDRAKTSTTHIDLGAISRFINQITFPIYFLDYETCSSAIPKYRGYHPQQQIVFQYSLHRLDNPGDVPVHSGFISSDKNDPCVPILERLSKEIGDIGSIVAWNDSFEKGRNEEMALLHPEYAEFLSAVNHRMNDLADIVSQGYYVHPGMKGSYSLKDVLPVLIPDLSYDGLEINHGDQASYIWWIISFGELDDAEKNRLLNELIRYCELDTLAMVRIYLFFSNFVEDSGSLQMSLF